MMTGHYYRATAAKRLSLVFVTLQHGANDAVGCHLPASIELRYSHFVIASSDMPCSLRLQAMLGEVATYPRQMLAMAKLNPLPVLNIFRHAARACRPPAGRIRNVATSSSG